MTFAIPAQRLCETPIWVAFHHPKPVYPTHILIVPKRSISDLSELDTEEESLLSDLFQVAQSLVDELGLEEIGYRLILNGGEYQEIPLLHFHLVSDEIIVSNSPSKLSSDI